MFRGIVLCITYYVYACHPVITTLCSEPLIVPTQVMPWRTPRNYGDVAGPVTPDLEFTPPDGYMNIGDVSALLLTNQNWGTANLPQVHPTWVDLIGSGEGSPPDYYLNVTVLQGLLHSLKWAVPFEGTGLGALNPGACP